MKMSLKFVLWQAVMFFVVSMVFLFASFGLGWDSGWKVCTSAIVPPFLVVLVVLSLKLLLDSLDEDSLAVLSFFNGLSLFLISIPTSLILWIPIESPAREVFAVSVSSVLLAMIFGGDVLFGDIILEGSDARRFFVLWVSGIAFSVVVVLGPSLMFIPVFITSHTQFLQFP